MTHARKPRRKQYRPRPLRYPMMAPLKQQISLDMHLALARLRTDPHDDARTDLAATFNTVGVAIENDHRFQEEVLHLNAGGAVLQGYVAPAALTDDQLAILAHTCAVIDTILGLLDVPTLWAAEKVAVELMRAARTTGA
ncbi:hypothetical protein [Achromobacter denitrificans]|uniref:hypothetical protein n=1 Tax=Achromobacter denitrificans TaxID=32002 RepID=UPI000F67AD1E|nr:hypothetical protein [Achromobacter denitrificans]RSE85540.1 hypothetical protein EGU64_12620 [Achromobacter denitrificans]